MWLPLLDMVSNRWMAFSALHCLFLFVTYNVLLLTSKDSGGETIMRTYHLQEWIEMVQALAIKLMARLPELLEEYNRNQKN